jgi:tetratricopeptide (TPR) repeat protein
MWYKYLLKLLVAALLAWPLSARAQAPFCDNEKAIDSAIHWISHTYSYTGQGWQDACDSLLVICPDLDQVWQMKAMPCIKMGDWHGCFSNLTHAVQINPEGWLGYQAFLKCMFTKDYAGALRDFQRCDTLVRGAGVMDHSYDFFMGICCLGMKDYKGAYTYLKKDVDNQAKRRGNDNVHYVSLYFWGMYQYLNGTYAEAVTTFRRVLKIFPQYPEPSFYLGMTLKKLGKEEEAQVCFRKAREGLLAGYNSNEDQEFYINYPYAIALPDIEEQIGSK